MNSRCFLWLIGFSILFSLVSVQAAEAPGTVVLTLEQFDALRAKVEDYVPPFAIPTAEYHLSIEGSRAVVNARLDIVVLREDWALVPLFKKGVVVDEAALDGDRAFLMSDAEGNVSLILGKHGGALEVSFHTDVREERGFLVADFTIPPAGMANLTADFPYEEVKAYVNGRFAATSLDEQRHSILEAPVGSVAEIALHWLPLSAEIESKVSADETLFVKHEQGVIEYQASLNLQIAQRPMDSISIPLEEIYAVNSVVGGQVAGYEHTGGVLTVRLWEPVLGTVGLKIGMARGYPEDLTESLSVPVVLPREAKDAKGYVALAASLWYRATVDRKENLQPTTANSLAEKELRSQAAIVFNFQSPDWVLTYTLEKIEPEFTAAVYNTVTFGETTCIVGSNFECLVQQGYLQFFDISDVPGFRLESVTGQEVRDWTADPETGLVRVILTSPERGKVAFSATFRKTYRDGEGIPIRFSEIRDPKRLRGFVTVQPQTNVTVTASDPRNLEPLDPSEIPLSMQTSGGGGALYAYRYLDQPVSLRLGVQRFEGIDMEESIVRNMLTRLTYSLQGSVRSESTMEILNTQTDRIPLRIGEGATVREAKLSDAPIVPAPGEEPGSIVMPVPRSKTKVSRALLDYLVTGEPLGKRRDAVLPIPKLPLPIDHLLVQVIPPAGYEVELLSEGVFHQVPPPEPEDLPAPKTDLHWLTGPGGEGSIPSKPVEQEMKKIAVALETYYIDHNTYPPRLQNLTTPIDYVKADKSILERYVYETDALGLTSWKLGVELPCYPEERTGRRIDEGTYFEARLLRDEPEGMTLEEMLSVQVRLSRKGRGLFGR